MAHRTTLLLDDATRAAAQELASRMRVTVSEAIRRAILDANRRSQGLTEADRQSRLLALKQLVQSFEGYDPAEELRDLAEDDGF
ncbi:unnamed protein product [Phaeothamnion confervicola]